MNFYDFIQKLHQMEIIDDKIYNKLYEWNQETLEEFYSFPHNDLWYKSTPQPYISAKITCRECDSHSFYIEFNHIEEVLIPGALNYYKPKEFWTIKYELSITVTFDNVNKEVDVIGHYIDLGNPKVYPLKTDEDKEYMQSFINYSIYKEKMDYDGLYI